MVVTYELCSGLDDQDESIAIQAFPNPTKDILNVASDQGMIESVSLIDLTGKEVMVKNNASSASQVSLFLEDVAPGTYLLKVMVDGRASFNRIVVN